MKINVGGARGGRTVSGAAFSAFGGDTTCFLVEGEAGERIVVDGGSGLMHFSDSLLKPGPLLFLFSHYHLDHLAGFVPFAARLDRRADYAVWGPQRNGVGPVQALSVLLGEPYWPVGLSKSQLTPISRALDPYNGMKAATFGNLQVRWCDVAHPGGSLALRIDECSTEKSVVIATDMEWGLCTAEQKQRLRSLCSEASPVDVLIMDAQYADDEYEAHRGWGHSTWQEATALAEACEVADLRITHHGPDNDDNNLRAREAAMQAVMPTATFLCANDRIEL
jgi:ribonuclease BN (tRNA processing enzyme)